MKCLDFYNKLNSLEDSEYIEKYLLYSASLVIAGVKPAITVTINKSIGRLYNTWNKSGKIFIKEIGLEFINLRESENSIILMIYDKEILKKIFDNTQNKEFLIRLGYSKDFSIDAAIKTLRFRYNQFHCPHELGLFLGIPFEDVKDFMECTEKRCLLCGYWKVYNNSNKAKKIFNKYDEIKEFAIKHILKGNNSSHDLIVNIKDSFYDNVKYI